MFQKRKRRKEAHVVFFSFGLLGGVTGVPGKISEILAATLKSRVYLVLTFGRIKYVRRYCSLVLNGCPR